MSNARFAGSEGEPPEENRGLSQESERGLRRTTLAPSTDDRFDVPLHGIDVGPATRCAHYHRPQDIIAIRFPCCDAFYPCFACHEASTEHAPERWTADQYETPAVLCGKCGTVLTIQQYLNTDHTCPACGAAFNPGCAGHHDLYFEVH